MQFIFCCMPLNFKEMKTKIIIKKEWKVIKEYDFLLTMNSGDIVEIFGIDYKIDLCVLELENDTMCILLNS